MGQRYRFNRMEIAGSLGDLGTLLPMAIGMILINGLHPMGMFFAIGLYYIFSGIYFGVTTPVQPMKVIGAYAIATGMSAAQVLAAGLLMGFFLLLIGATNLITAIGKWVPKSVVRGVQLSTGVLLMDQGIKFMAGTSTFQALHHLAEPYLRIQHVGPLPIGILVGAIGGMLTFLLLENKRLPAGIVVVAGGLLIGAIFGTHEELAKLRFGFQLPAFMPFSFPGKADFVFAFFALVLPQLPMTLGNAVIADADLSRDYFGPDSARVTYRGLTLSMALANIATFFFGGMPLCHGAGGLAAHHRFGARSAGSNLVIGFLFLALALVFGTHALAVVSLIPMAVLGVLLLFAGSQLALTIADLTTRKDLFVTLVILGITLASNLAVGFGVGIAVAYAMRSDAIRV